MYFMRGEASSLLYIFFRNKFKSNWIEVQQQQQIHILLIAIASAEESMVICEL
jgi:hypothetical protein